MESKSQNIIQIIEELLVLMKMSDSRQVIYFHDFLKNELAQLNKPHDLTKIAQTILNVYGGMGTFNDIALFKNGKILDEEDKFEELREKLYKSCKDAVIESRM
jgi:hypothetical protein